MKVKPLVVAVLLLVATYLPAFMLVSVLVVASPAFASAVESIPWLPVPIIIVVTLITATLLIIRIGRGELSRYGLTLPQWSGLWKPILMGLIFGTLIHLVETSLSIESTLMGEPPLLYGVLLF